MRFTVAPKAIILYGSHARGDADRFSDVDLCVLIANGACVTEQQVTGLISTLPQDRVALTVYEESALEHMVESGSLFLWHLKLEGRVLLGDQYVRILLQSLKPFRRHREELRYHCDILNDLRTEEVSIRGPNEFDLSVLFSIVRNSCMLLAHHKGVPVFGREVCYLAAARLYPDLPITERQYMDLSQWKLVYERGETPTRPLPRHNEFLAALTAAERLLEYGIARTG